MQVKLKENSIGSIRRVGIEFRKFYAERQKNGFIDKYLSGRHILDIGYQGGDAAALPITESAIGVDLDYPGYDGIHLPFEDGSQDAVFASHVLEHIANYKAVLEDWYRVVKTGGYIIIFVPHKYLYERRPGLPSRWNGDHKRFYTPCSLLMEVEESLPTNGFRVRHLADNDAGFSYEKGINCQPQGGYEIELVIQKIHTPDYSLFLENTHDKKLIKRHIDEVIIQTINDNLHQKQKLCDISVLLGRLSYITPWAEICRLYYDGYFDRPRSNRVTEVELKAAIKLLLQVVDVDEKYYLATYPELRAAVEEGRVKDASMHWRTHGYFEGRLHREFLP